MTNIPQSVRDAVDAALDELPDPDSPFERDRWRIVSRVTLEAAAPLLAETIRREMAREVLALDAADAAIESKPSTNKGPWGDVRASLNRLVKGKPLPRPEELRGGFR